MMVNRIDGFPSPVTGGGSARIRREALLFRAGEYDDKGVRVTAADLVRLVDSFRPVPILVEHAESALDLGELAEVRADGEILFGTVALTESADRLLRESNATELSVGLASDLSAIRELSLVRRPRVEGARLFAREDRVTFDSELTLPPADLSAADEELVSSRLTPAARPFARALLASAARISFGRESQGAGALVRSLLSAMPRHRFGAEPVTGERSLADPDADASLFTPEEAAFYRRHFPGTPLREIARHR